MSLAQKMLPFTMLTIAAIGLLPLISVSAGTLSERDVDGIAIHSEQKCVLDSKKVKKKPPAGYCHSWAQCYAKEVQKTTTLEEMKAADALVKSGKKPGKDFFKKMVRANATCAQQLSKATK